MSFVILLTPKQALQLVGVMAIGFIIFCILFSLIPKPEPVKPNQSLISSYENAIARYEADKQELDKKIMNGKALIVDFHLDPIKISPSPGYRQITQGHVTIKNNQEFPMTNVKVVIDYPSPTVAPKIFFLEIHRTLTPPLKPGETLRIDVNSENVPLFRIAAGQVDNDKTFIDLVGSHSSPSPLVYVERLAVIDEYGEQGVGLGPSISELNKPGNLKQSLEKCKTVIDDVRGNRTNYNDMNREDRRWRAYDYCKTKL